VTGYGGIGFGCCCASTPNVEIFTTTCLFCVAPGIITVTIRSGPCPGGVIVFVGTANSAGLVLCYLAPGVYCVSSSTTAGGYSSQGPTTFTVPDSGLVTVGCGLYPTTLTGTSATLGSATMLSTGAATPIGTPVPGQIWIGMLNYSFGGNCGCGALTIPLYFMFNCSYPGPSLIIFMPEVQSGPNLVCPTSAYSGTPGPYAAIEALYSASGFITSPCWPINLSESVTIYGSIGTGAGQAVYGLCGVPAPPLNFFVTDTLTVTS
jgi:hypothetical protein